MIYEDGTTYLWYGEFWHGTVKLKVPSLDTTQFHFAFYRGWEFSLNRRYMLDEAIIIINKNKNFLSKIGGLNSEVYIGPDIDGKSYTFKSVDEIKVPELEPAMARLIGKNVQSEIYEGYTGLSGTYYECFKNPTKKEWDELYKIAIGIRAFLYEDGTCYAWTGTIQHRDAIRYFNIPEGLHLLIEDQDFTFYLTPKITIDYFLNSIKNCTCMDDFMSYRIDEINTTFYKAQFEPIYQDFEELSLIDIKNYQLPK